jgi:hypothetical protein
MPPASAPSIDGVLLLTADEKRIHDVFEDGNIQDADVDMYFFDAVASEDSNSSSASLAESGIQPETLSLFAFPRGLRVLSFQDQVPAPPNSLHTFSVTNSDGRLHHCHCLTRWLPAREMIVATIRLHLGIKMMELVGTGDESDQNTVEGVSSHLHHKAIFEPHCYLVLSTLANHSIFSAALKQYEAEINMQEALAKVVEAKVLNLTRKLAEGENAGDLHEDVCDVETTDVMALERCRKDLAEKQQKLDHMCELHFLNEFACAYLDKHLPSPLRYTPGLFNEVSPTAVSLQPLLQCLGTDNIICLFTQLLLENQIALVSSDVSKLHPCLEATRAMLYPVAWPHAYVSFLPHDMHLVLGAPFPFLVGVLRSNLEGSDADEIKRMAGQDAGNNKPTATGKTNNALESTVVDSTVDLLEWEDEWKVLQGNDAGDEDGVRSSLCVPTFALALSLSLSLPSVPSVRTFCRLFAPVL